MKANRSQLLGRSHLLRATGMGISGLAIATMNADAAREVWEAAREEHRTADASA